MELITNIITEYLKHNKRIVVPKLGAFIVKQPSGHIIFSELMRNDDGVLRSLLMAYGIRDLEANGLIDRLAFDVHHAISRNESYTLEGLGDFLPGDNDTIVFKHKRTPVVYGGNIKPPVETLTAEKLKFQSFEAARGLREGSATATKPERNAKQETKAKAKRQAKDKEINTLSLGKPEAYLRGLKYDKGNGKKYGDERAEVKRRKRPAQRSKFRGVVFALIIFGTALWGGWQLFVNKGYTIATIAETIGLAEPKADAMTGADIKIVSMETAAETASATVSDNETTK